MPFVTPEAERQVDLWDFEASLVGLVRVQDSQPRLHRETLSKNKNKTRKIKTNKKPLKKKSELFNGGRREEGCCSGAGATGVIWARDEGGFHRRELLYCDFFEFLGMVRLAAATFSFETSGMVQ